MDRRRMLLRQPRLPSGYQEVEWIGNSGSSYINTLYRFLSENAMIKIKYLYTGFRAPASIFGSCGDGEGKDKNWFILYSPPGYVNLNRLYIGSSSQILPFRSLELNAIYDEIIACDSSGVTRITNGDIKSYAIRRGTIISNSDILLFTNSLDNTPQTERSAYINIYHCKIYDNGEIVRNFIPCYRKSDGVIGMYDLCGSICPLTSTSFYINEGTGTFTKGPDVN